MAGRQRSGSKSSSRRAHPKYPRGARVGATLREIIADELVRIDDERLSLVSITGIDVDPELNRAIVFFDSLEGEDGDAAILEALGDHRIRLQSSIAKQIRAKKTPILDFRPDLVIRSAERIDAILRSDRDRSNARNRAIAESGPPRHGRARSRPMARRRPASTHGLAIVDKPAGVTSHDVVGMLRRRFGERQVGHGGTLDPDATGVLVVAVGMATRLLRFVERTQKEYVGEVVLGTETNTLDAAGEVTATFDMSGVTVDDARRVVAAHLTGPILQIPPMVSAIRVDGKRLHELAREGIEIERQPRPWWSTASTCGRPTIRSCCASRSSARPAPTSARSPPISARCSAGERTCGPSAGRGSVVHHRRGRGPDECELLPVDAAVRSLARVEVDDATAALIANGRVLPRWDGPGPWAVFGDGGTRLLAVYESFARGDDGQTGRRPAPT